MSYAMQSFYYLICNSKHTPHLSSWDTMVIWITHIANDKWVC